MKIFGSVIALCLLLISPMSAQATTLGLNSRDGCPFDYPVRFYLIEEESGAFEEVEPVVDPIWRYCGVFSLTRRRSDGAYYALGYERENGYEIEPVLIRITPGTWDMTTVGRLTVAPGIVRPGRWTNPVLWALAFSPDDELYAHYWHYEDPALHVLVRLDPETGAEEARIELTGVEHRRMNSIEFAPDRTLYGWNNYTGLHTIDPATGVIADVRPGDEDEPNMISEITFGWDGTLYGFSDYFWGPGADGWILTIDTRTGGIRRETYMGSEWHPGIGWFPYLTAVANVGPRISLVERPPRRFWKGNMYLLDCMGCPHCFGRMCDPRVNLDLDQLFLIEPKSGVAEILSRTRIGLRREDGAVTAGAPIEVDDKTLFVLAAPLAGKAVAGAILFLDAKGNLVSRFDGRSGETLGMAMDVRGSDIVVASSHQLVRFRGTKVVSRLGLDKSLHAQQSLLITFTDDVDGDKQPDIRLGAPYATANDLKEAGVIQLIGSRTGQVIKSEVGSYARQHLGRRLP